ncbi:S-adenosyl-L-methionine-dependent methyltransferase [Ceratobasidium sp. AG-I]|nr:S-adenosyl-L-methionine-dependent methyltransferase [Ceratobasidium sp. AG-I]
MTMIAAILSAVEHYQPKYFLIENVPDALTCKLLGPSPHGNSSDDDSPAGTPPPRHPIDQGVLRFVMRATLDLGYSFRAGILQSGCYGAPQRRRRAFIMGARGDLTLPAFPLASHRIQTPRTGLMMPTGGYSDPAEQGSGFCIHQRTTLWDAIGDLKAFEWSNPHSRIAETTAARNEARQRRTNGIPVFSAVHDDRREVGLGAAGAVAYRDGTPLTTYQLQARGNQERVTAHYTSSFKSEVFVERVVSVPISARADHRSLPEILRRDDFLSNIFGSGGASGYYRGAFGRYDKNDLFATILTSLRPAKKNGFCIHPEQKRMLTMRELARAQGFPDDFEFQGSIDEVNRQIGNAVVVQVARALGNEIKKAMIKDRLL